MRYAPIVRFTSNTSLHFLPILLTLRIAQNPSPLHPLVSARFLYCIFMHLCATNIVYVPVYYCINTSQTQNSTPFFLKTPRHPVKTPKHPKQICCLGVFTGCFGIKTPCANPQQKTASRFYFKAETEEKKAYHVNITPLLFKSHWQTASLHPLWGELSRARITGNIKRSRQTALHVALNPQKIPSLLHYI